MAKQVQLRSGTTIEHSTFTGAVGEVTVDTTKNVVVVHDGMTAGGTPMLKASDVPSASETVQGKIEIATQTEVNTGTDSERAVTPATLKSTIPTQTKSALNASGNAPIYACRAWVNFNGTGTVAIRASGNVSSITDSGTGSYTINFTTAMPDANYAASGSVSNRGGNDSQSVILNELASNSVSVYCQFGGDNTPGRFDPTNVCVQVVR